MKHESPIKRRKSRQIMVGNVPVGGDAPIAVQSMTNTNTCDVEATVGQIRALEQAGADIVRVSVPSMEAAEAFSVPVGRLLQRLSSEIVNAGDLNLVPALWEAQCCPPATPHQRPWRVHEFRTYGLDTIRPNEDLLDGIPTRKSDAL